MPSSPEIADGHGGIGVPEVFKNGKAEHMPHTDGHIAVSAEVIIDLERIAYSAEPHQTPVRTAGKAVQVAVENGVCDISDGVRDQYFLGETHNKAPYARCGLLCGADAAVYLKGDVVVFDDGAGD